MQRVWVVIWSNYNIQADHVDLLVKALPMVSISKLMGTVKGRTALQIFKQFSYLK